MQKESAQKKVVLAIAGHDPTGAAGIQADIETISAAGCQCVSIITALTRQNTLEFLELIPQQPEHFRKQYTTLLADIKPDACKIGLIGSLSIAEIITEIIDTVKTVPIVLDPIINAGAGNALTTPEMVEYITRDILKRVFVLTPNSREARQLTGLGDIYEAGEKLVAAGCPYVLVTGADEKTSAVTNILFTRDGSPENYQWERLPGIYHGSGCTLSSAIAASLAQGTEPLTAIRTAQEYTWKCLKYGGQYGRNQMHPDRFHGG